MQVDVNAETVYVQTVCIYTCTCTCTCTCMRTVHLISSFQIDVCRMELTPNKISWKRASQLVKVGTMCSSDDLTSTKEKCARALAMSMC